MINVNDIKWILPLLVVFGTFAYGYGALNGSVETHNEELKSIRGKLNERGKQWSDVSGAVRGIQVRLGASPNRGESSIPLLSDGMAGKADSPRWTPKFEIRGDWKISPPEASGEILG